MTVQHSVVSVLTTATKLNVVADTDNQSGSSLLFICPTGVIYLGGSTVTSSTGTPIPANTPVAFDLTGGENLYAAAASTLATYVTQTGV